MSNPDGLSEARALSPVEAEGQLAAHLLALRMALACPITRKLIDRPVETSDGHVFERMALMNWVRAGNETSPVTGAVLVRTTYQSAIAEELRILLNDGTFALERLRRRRLAT